MRASGRGEFDADAWQQLNGRALPGIVLTDQTPSGVAVNPATEAVYLAGNSFMVVDCPPNTQ